MDTPSHAPTSLEGAYHAGFVAAMVVCFSPLKSLPYLAPAAFTAWLYVNDRTCIHSRRAGLAFWAVLIAPVFYTLVAPEFLLLNYVLAIVTYSTCLPLLFIDGRRLASPALFRKLSSATIVMIGIQGAIGIVQAVSGALESGSFSGGNGDRVQGSIHLALSSESSFSNPMFAANIGLMLLACLASPGLLSGRRRFAGALGLIALVLASVVHVLIFLLAATAAGFLIVRPRTTKRVRAGTRNLVFACGIAAALAYVAIPKDVANASAIAETAIDFDTLAVPRAIMLYRVFTELPDAAPYQPLVGLGPGQFSSRASLIASGYYLGGADNPQSLPWLKPQTTRLTDAYCVSLMIAFADQGETIGSTHQPFFSVLSVYTELGLLGLLLILWAFWRVIRGVRRRAQQHRELRPRALILVIGIVFALLLGLQENYWEVPQALLVGALLLKVLHANIVYSDPAAVESSRSHLPTNDDAENSFARSMPSAAMRSR